MWDAARRSFVQDYFPTSTPKVSDSLRKHLPGVGKSSRWATPLGVSLSLILTILTADFKEVFGLEAALVKGIFYAFAIMALIWLIRGLWYVIGAKTVNEIIAEIIREIKPQ